MFIPGHCLQVFWPIIIFNAIDMVNNPILRQLPPVSLLPNQAMFSNIIIPTSIINKYITTGFPSTTRPLRVFFATRKFPKFIFTVAILAINCSYFMKLLVTQLALTRISFKVKFYIILACTTWTPCVFKTLSFTLKSITAFLTNKLHHTMYILTPILSIVNMHGIKEVA